MASAIALQARVCHEPEGWKLSRTETVILNSVPSARDGGLPVPEARTNYPGRWRSTRSCRSFARQMWATFRGEVARLAGHVRRDSARTNWKCTLCSCRRGIGQRTLDCVGPEPIWFAVGCLEPGTWGDSKICSRASDLSACYSAIFAQSRSASLTTPASQGAAVQYDVIALVPSLAASTIRRDCLSDCGPLLVPHLAPVVLIDRQWKHPLKAFGSSLAFDGKICRCGRVHVWLQLQAALSASKSKFSLACEQCSHAHRS